MIQQLGVSRFRAASDGFFSLEMPSEIAPRRLHIVRGESTNRNDREAIVPRCAGNSPATIAKTPLLTSNGSVRWSAQ